MPKTVSSGFVWGVADGYSLSRPHRDFCGRNFPAVRDGKSADTVVIDGDVPGGNAVLLFRVVHVDMVDQLRHHALGNFGGVGVPPDSCKKCVNVHPLALALFQLQPQRLDPLGVLPLLLLVPLGHLRKPGVADFLAHVVLVQPFKKPVQLFVPRQKPIQLPLLPDPLVLRHFCGAAHHSFNEIVLVLVGETGQPVHLVQHHPLQKFQPDIVGLGALAQTGIVVLATKEFNIVVALVEVEIEVAAALRAFQNAGKGAGLLGDGGPPPACPLFHALHLFPGGPVYNGLVDVEEDRPVLLRVLDPLFHLVGLGVGLEVDHVPAILLQGEDFLDRGMAPLGRFYSTLGTAPTGALAPPVVGGIEHPIPLQRGGGFRQPIAVQGHSIDTPHNLGGLRVDHPKAGVLRVFDVAIGGRGQRYAGIAFHFVHDPALLGNIAGVVFVHDIFERGKLILALVAVHSVGDGHQPDIVGREKFFRQAAHLNVVPAQPGKVFHEHRRYVPAFDGLEHFLQAGTLHGGACNPILHEKQGVRIAPLPRRLLENFLLIADAVGFGVQIIVTAEAAVQRRRPKLVVLA